MINALGAALGSTIARHLRPGFTAAREEGVAA
jgi:hypothetical protein